MGRWSVPAVIVLAACPYISKDDHDLRLSGCDEQETPGDGIDGDCDGYELCYLDRDGDRVGSMETESVTDFECSAEGHAVTSGDCDDNDIHRFPGNDEECDEKDQDCSPDPVSDCLPVPNLELSELYGSVQVFFTGDNLGDGVFGGHYDNDRVGDLMVWAKGNGTAEVESGSLTLFNKGEEASFGTPDLSVPWSDSLGAVLGQTPDGRGLAFVSEGALSIASGGGVLTWWLSGQPLESAGGSRRFTGSIAFALERTGVATRPILAAGVRWSADDGSAGEEEDSVVLVQWSPSEGASPDVWISKWFSSPGAKFTHLGVVEGASARSLLVVSETSDDKFFVESVSMVSTDLAGFSPEAVEYLPESTDRITQVLGCDTDGDGSEEVVVVGYPPPAGGGAADGFLRVYPAPAPPSVPAGEPLYSMEVSRVMSTRVAAACTDFDGNGIGDLVVSHNRVTAGWVGVFLGRWGGPVSALFKEEDADLSWTGSGEDWNVGASVTGVPDRNGDGMDEIALGMPQYTTDATEPGGGGFAVIYGGRYD